MIKFWSWYDSIREPWRFLFAIVVLSSPLHLFAITSNGLFMAGFLPIVGTRMWYIYKKSTK